MILEAFKKINNNKDFFKLLQTELIKIFENLIKKEIIAAQWAIIKYSCKSLDDIMRDIIKGYWKGKSKFLKRIEAKSFNFLLNNNELKKLDLKYLKKIY